MALLMANSWQLMAGFSISINSRGPVHLQPDQPRACVRVSGCEFPATQNKANQHRTYLQGGARLRATVLLGGLRALSYWPRSWLSVLLGELGALTLVLALALALALRDELLALSSVHAQALSRDKPIRIALDQTMSDESATLHESCEVAFFPPVTGG